MGLFGKSKQSASRVGALGGNGEFDYEVVGESAHKQVLGEMVRKASDEERANGEIYTQAVLTPEPDNAIDKRAIAVSIDGRRIGYIPASETDQFHNALKASGMSGFQVKAVIGWNPNNPGAPIGVRLDIE